MRSYTDRICKYCQKPFKVLTKRVTQGNGKFCSRSCCTAANNKGRILPAEERFWSLVNKTEACWLWTGFLDKDGYGHISIEGKKRKPAHVFSWEIHNGPVPKGLFVCHNCPGGDNPTCVNPDHLWLGTPQENSMDAYRKGMYHMGETVKTSKLKTEQVFGIRTIYSLEGTTIRKLARQFNVGSSQIARIIHRESWKHIP